MATWRVAVDADGDVDRHAALLPAMRFTRSDGVLYVECRDGAESRVRALLGRAGLRLDPAALPERSPSLVAARVVHLERLLLPGAVDVVSIEAVPVGEATAIARRARRGPFPWRGPDDTEVVRALLRDDDRAYRWGRLLFAPAAVLRASRRGGLRPVVFDRGALERGPQHVAFARSGALTAWVRA